MQRAESWLLTPASCIGVLVLALAALLLPLLPANAPGKSSGGWLRAWAPDTPGGGLAGVPGSWLGPGPALAVEAI